MQDKINNNNNNKLIPGTLVRCLENICLCTYVKLNISIKIINYFAQHWRTRVITKDKGFHTHFKVNVLLKELFFI